MAQRGLYLPAEEDRAATHEAERSGMAFNEYVRQALIAVRTGKVEQFQTKVTANARFQASVVMALLCTSLYLMTLGLRAYPWLLSP